jgi:hypothetical protein
MNMGINMRQSPNTPGKYFNMTGLTLMEQELKIYFQFRICAFKLFNVIINQSIATTTIIDQ